MTLFFSRFFVLAAAGLLAGVGLLIAASPRQQYRVWSVPGAGDTFQLPCVYQMTLPHPEHRVRGVVVIFDRGWQFGNLYFSQAFFDFAEQRDFALLLAVHCAAKGQEDIDVVPENGLGRALLGGIDQLGAESRHPELARSPLVYLGFSGSGVLAARMVNFAPDRTLAAIEYAPSQGDPVGMHTVTLADPARRVPQLIIANGADRVSGTARPYAYFEEYRKLGAPLTFLVQNRTPHCCVKNVVPLMLDWLADVVRQRIPVSEGQPMRNVVMGEPGILLFEDAGVKDTWGAKVWNVVSAGGASETGKESAPVGLNIPRAPLDGQVPSAATSFGIWLPSKSFAKTWRAFSLQREHEITPLQ